MKRSENTQGKANKENINRHNPSAPVYEEKIIRKWQDTREFKLSRGVRAVRDERGVAGAGQERGLEVERIGREIMLHTEKDKGGERTDK